MEITDLVDFGKTSSLAPIRDLPTGLSLAPAGDPEVGAARLEPVQP
ncbi:MAG TPA: hypothetical protein VFD49_19880 [Candidatus Dormibacteraeota bacterium]|nr:hypothetical protein [Candidatus Dormibacteraeota bacterium]